MNDNITILMSHGHSLFSCRNFAVECLLGVSMCRGVACAPVSLAGAIAGPALLGPPLWGATGREGGGCGLWALVFHVCGGKVQLSVSSKGLVCESLKTDKRV